MTPNFQQFIVSIVGGALTIQASDYAEHGDLMRGVSLLFLACLCLAFLLVPPKKGTQP